MSGTVTWSPNDIACGPNAADSPQRMLRVLVHDYSGHPFQVQLSRELARRGHRVLHLHCPSYASGKGNLATRPGDPPALEIRAVPLRTNFARHSPARRVLQELEYGRALLPHVRRFEPDAVLSANTPLLAQLLLHRECKRTGAAIVYWQQDLYGEAMKRGARRRLPVAGSLAGEAFVALERRIVRDSDAVVAISEDFKPTLMRWGVSDTRIAVIENWAPLEEVAPAPRDNTWARGHDLVGRRVVLYAGTLGMKHDPSLLLALAERLLEEDDVRVVVVSEGRGREWLERQSLPANLVLLDFQPYDALPLVLASADVLAVILEPDAGAYSVPSKVLTYLCAGRPLLAALPASNLAARVIEKSGSGLICDPKTPEAFVAAAKHLLADSNLRQSMGKWARVYAENAFEVERIADQFQAVISRAIGEVEHD